MPRVQELPNGCDTVVSETVCVQADITISPKVEVGTIETYCVGSPVIGPCQGNKVEECTFSVSQRICVQIPLTFSAEASAEPTGIVCGEPALGGCGVPQ